MGRGGGIETERHQPDFTMNEQPNAGQMAFSLVGRMKGVGLDHLRFFLAL